MFLFAKIDRGCTMKTSEKCIEFYFRLHAEKKLMPLSYNLTFIAIPSVLKTVF